MPVAVTTSKLLNSLLEKLQQTSSEGVSPEVHCNELIFVSAEGDQIQVNKKLKGFAPYVSIRVDGTLIWDNPVGGEVEEAEEAWMALSMFLSEAKMDEQGKQRDSCWKWITDGIK